MVDQRGFGFLLGVTLGACSLVAASDEPDIHAAASAGDVQRVAALLAESPELIAARDKEKKTPLHHAVKRLQIGVVKHLLDRGADIGESDIRSGSVLHLVMQANSESSDGEKRRTVLTELLIRNGADVNARDFLRKTPLHLAAIRGREQVLDLLYDAGAEIKVVDGWGHTPLHDAALFNHKAVITWMLKKKADVHAKSGKGDTPLHSAARRFRKEATRLLLTAGADANAPNDRGHTPLHLTTIAGPTETEVDALMAVVAEQLLTAGADANATDGKGRTPLHLAIERRRTKVAAVLRRHGGKE